jgi:hypothetical protein
VRWNSYNCLIPKFQNTILREIISFSLSLSLSLSNILPFPREGSKFVRFFSLFGFAHVVQGCHTVEKTQHNKIIQKIKTLCINGRNELYENWNMKTNFVFVYIFTNVVFLNNIQYNTIQYNPKGRKSEYQTKKEAVKVAPRQNSPGVVPRGF